jgi:hypothetical protein
MTPFDLFLYCVALGLGLIVIGLCLGVLAALFFAIAGWKK